MAKFFSITELGGKNVGIRESESLPELVSEEFDRGSTRYYRQVTPREATVYSGEDLVFAFPGFYGTPWEPGRVDQVLRGDYESIQARIPELEDSQYATSNGFFGIPISEESISKVREALKVLGQSDWA